MNSHNSHTRNPLIANFCSGELNGIWMVSDIFILIAGVLANAALLWLFLRDRKSLSASQVLGLNLVAMDFVYLSFLPVGLVYANRELNLTTSEESRNVTSGFFEEEAYDVFIVVGCPLLLSCMCFERYLAVVKPVLYLRVRKWEYRAAVCAAVWGITTSISLLQSQLDDSMTVFLLNACIISCLFGLMLVCLWGMVSSLRQKCPAHSSLGGRGHSESPRKRRALANVLFVVVLSVFSYVPVMVIIPMALYMTYCGGSVVNETMCQTLQVLMLFPRHGVLIGPMFYLSKARKLC